MRPLVDIVGTEYPVRSSATTGTHIPRATARNLIKEKTMRPILFGLLCMTASCLFSCLADVGGDECDSRGPPGSAESGVESVLQVATSKATAAIPETTNARMAPMLGSPSAVAITR